MRYTSLSLAAAIALGFTASAQAGGFVAPVVEAEPVTPVAVAPVAGAWQGGYAGLALGYAFGGDDEVGVFSPAGGFLGNVGNAEVSGVNLDAHIGYRWQRDRWVFGPELSYMGGNIDDEFDFANTLGSGTVESEVDNVLALKVKTGYLVQPDMLVYGIAGWQSGNFTYTVSGVEEEYDADGYVLGLGVEKKFTERMSVTGEYEYSDFGTTDVDVGGGFTTNASPAFSNVKVGVNFKF